MKDDLWAEWPDGYMCPIGQVEEMMTPPLARSDDYHLVRVAEYDGTGEPCSWEAVTPPVSGPIVGHKTYDDGEGGFRHEPLYASEAEQLLADVHEAEQRRAKAMPETEDALRVMFEAWVRLTELGWKEAIYCPKDGTEFEAIEAGSRGIFRCHYEGEWPNGGWWIADHGDLWPSRPILFRRLPEDG